MASEAQKPLAKTEFLLVCGQLATVSLEPCIKVHNFFPFCFWEVFLFANSENIYKEFRSTKLESKFIQVGRHNDVDNCFIYNWTQMKTTLFCKTTKFIQCILLAQHTELVLIHIYTTSACLLVIFVCVYDFLVSSLENKRYNMIEGQHRCTII